MSEKTTHGVIKQASFLMIATMICRVIGLLYRTPLHGIMGNVGDGYYSLAYDWYNIILLISSYSIPMAVSKVMAELLASKEYRNAQKVFYAALIYVLIVGGGGALAAFFGAPYLLSTQPEAVLALRVLAPTIMLSGFLGVLRGYFQARNTMVPTALSQIMEQIVNAVISVVAAWAFTRRFIGSSEIEIGKYGAAGGTLGTGAGVLAGILVMLLVYIYNRKRVKKHLMHDRTEADKSYGEVFKMIFMMVSPVILATCVYNVVGIVDQTLFTRLMPLTGASEVEISVQYALFGYQFKPIMNIPTALASATSTALIPAIATAMALGNKKDAGDKIRESVTFTMFLAIPCAVGMAVLSLPIIRILYPSANENSAALVLSVGAIAVIFYCLSTVTNGVLQGLGKPSLPVRNSAIALVVNVLVQVFATLVLKMGIFALLLSSIMYAVTVSLLNYMSVKKLVDYKNDMKNAVVLPLSAAAVMAVVVGILYWVPAFLLKDLMNRYIVNAIWSLLVVLIGVVTFILAYVKVSGKTVAELRRMPFGTRMLQVMRLLRIKVPETTVVTSDENEADGTR
ncbi:MAG: polysaccharide biosynthesis protein [Lachnospiraceae bacterium]|nr:polysaccharide biosynthesis protein [Lachnospiraceae bacterium]